MGLGDCVSLFAFNLLSFLSITSSFSLFHFVIVGVCSLLLLCCKNHPQVNGPSTPLVLCGDKAYAAGIVRIGWEDEKNNIID